MDLDFSQKVLCQVSNKKKTSNDEWNMSFAQKSP
jgi:hypothetical protein